MGENDKWLCSRMVGSHLGLGLQIRLNVELLLTLYNNQSLKILQFFLSRLEPLSGQLIPVVLDSLMDGKKLSECVASSAFEPRAESA